MNNGYFYFEAPQNEPVKSYAPGSEDAQKLKAAIGELKQSTSDIPMVIGGAPVRSGKTVELRPPHERNHLLGHFHEGDKSHAEQAIAAALSARAAWAASSWEHRASVFLKAAELLATKYRYKMNAATMLGQSKNAYQAEI